VRIVRLEGCEVGVWWCDRCDTGCHASLAHASLCHRHVLYDSSRTFLHRRIEALVGLDAWTEEGVAGPGRRVAACCLGACRDNESGLYARKVFRRPTCAQKRPQAAVAFSGWRYFSRVPSYR
jgi:hypothetical protein